VLITEAEFKEWRTHPVTVEVFGVLRWRMDEIGRTLAEGGALIEKEAAIWVGRYMEMKDLIDMTYEEMEEN